MIFEIFFCINAKKVVSLHAKNTTTQSNVTDTSKTYSNTIVMKRRLLFFVLFALFAGASATSASELNIYASGLRVNSVNAETNEVSIDYFLNAPATALEFQLINSSQTVVKRVSITTASLLTKGNHTTTIDLGDVVGGTYNWALKATADASSLSWVTSKTTLYNFYSPQGLAVDNSYESDYFGRIYLAESMSATTGAGREKGEGIFIFGPGLDDITGQGNSSYNGGVSWNTNSTIISNTGNLKWDATGPARLTVADDGYVFICDNGRQGAATNTSSVWMMDPSNPSANFKEVLDVTKNNSIYHRVNSCAVKGSGANKVLYIIDWSDSIMSYPVGNCTTPYSNKGTTWRNNLAGHNIVNAFNTLVRGKDGGFWVFQFRGQLDTYPIVTHFNAAAERDFYISSESNSSLAPTSNTCRRGCGAVSPDGTKLAFYGNETMYIYDISYDANGVPSLSNGQTITGSVGGTNSDAIAFDFANNLYFASASKEYFFAYSTPKSPNTCTTPAKSTLTITLQTLVSVVNVTGVTLDQDSKTLKVGGSFTLTPTVTPEDATDKTYTWSSSDPTVATISDEGVVSALKAGTTTITVTTTDGEFTDECVVTVDPYTITYNTNGGTLSKTNEELWADFKPAYNAYYGLSRGNQSITAVATFANQYMQEFMTNENSSWKWLGDYMLSIATAQSYTLDTDAKWRFCAQAFFNCAEANAYAVNAPDFTTAGQPSAWLPSYTTANLPAHVYATFTLPTLVKTNYTFTGWTNGAGEKVTTVNQLADYTVTAHWVLTNPTTLAQAVDGKTIRRTLMNSGKLYVLAIDEFKNPYIYKINPETSEVEAIIPTTGCTNTIDLTIATGFTTMPLSDIAFTEDNVLVGMNADHMTYSGGPGTLRLYKWTSESSAPTLWASSQNASAAGSLLDAITAGAMTFVGNSTTGTSQAIAIIVNKNSPSEFRYAFINLTDGEHQNTRCNRSVVAGGTSDIKATTIGTDVQIHPSPLNGDFIITGSLCRPIEVIENATSGEAATYNTTEVIDAPTVGSYFFTEDAVKYMVIPTAAGISIYNITSGLADAVSVKDIDAANTATYRAVFAVRNEDDLVLYLQKDDVISKYTEEDFFAVTINSVTLNKDETSLVVGETETLTAEVDPDDAVVTVIWSSGNESVATVSDEGVVTAVSAGTAIITATAGEQSDQCTVTVTAPLPMAGTYKIGGAEPDYATLHAACEDINLRSLSADVTFLICADLSESANSGLVNTTDYTLTIKPDADADRTISFTNSESDNDGPSGGFVIGDKSENVGWTATPTKNIVIDGLASGTATHKMTIKTPSTFYNTAGPIIIYGHVTNTVIRNCKIINERTYCITLRNEKNTDNAPEGVIIENNILEATTAAAGQCIYINGNQAATAKTGAPKNTIIRNNELRAKHRGILIEGANGATIEGNTFKITQTAGGMMSQGILGNSGQIGTFNVLGNHFIELKTANTNDNEYGIRAITAKGGATKWVIANNYFDGLEATGSVATKNTLLTYILCSDLCEVLHNTFHMPSLPKAPATALNSDYPITCVQITTTKAHIIQNNLFVSDETEAHNSLISGTLPAELKHNVFYHAEGNASLTSSSDNIETLDASNIWQQVAFSETYKPATAYANSINLAMPRIDGLYTDIEGNERETATHAGCYAPKWTITLNDAQANTATINKMNGVQADVIIQRSFAADEGWYTLVLPFDVPAEQMAANFGNSCQLTELEESYWKVPNTMMYIRFSKRTHMLAGAPYLIKPAQNVSSLHFEKVTIDADLQPNETELVDMTGLYDPTNEIEADGYHYYLGDYNLLYPYTEDYHAANAFRAYLSFNISNPSGCSARIIFHEDAATGQEAISDQQSAVSCQKVIRDGQLIIIRNGQEYTIDGRMR